MAETAETSLLVRKADPPGGVEALGRARELRHRQPAQSAAELVFQSKNGKPLRHNLFYRRHFKRAVRAALPAALHGLRFHDLRHTCAALSVAAGAHVKLISARLGHSSVQITLDRYAHLFPSVEEALAEQLDATFATAAAANLDELRNVAELRP